jgi:hypothetical protein
MMCLLKNENENESENEKRKLKTKTKNEKRKNGNERTTKHYKTKNRILEKRVPPEKDPTLG